MDPLKKLAGAVFVNALKEAQKGSQEARLWLLEDDSSFPVWCRAYGVSPTLARRELGQAIETAPVTRWRRRELVIQALRESPEASSKEIGRRLKVNYDTVRQVRNGLLEACGPQWVRYTVENGEKGCEGEGSKEKESRFREAP